ncbi:MAG: hypothetical protein FWD40_03330 [Treponema sp.]|nr:hypothetical protein [Treponema sp.]
MKLFIKVLKTQQVFRLFLIFIVLTLCGCINFLDNEHGKIILVLGDGASRGMVFPPEGDILNQLEFTITITNSKEEIIFKVRGETQIEAIIASGIWNIMVEAHLMAEAHLEEVIYARGSAIANIQPGQENYVPIIMRKAFFTISITEGIENGVITPSHTWGGEGSLITLTIEPEEGYRIVRNSLTITPAVEISGTGLSRAFILPDYDVVINAAFEIIPIYTVETIIEGMEYGSIIINPQSAYEDTVIEFLMLIEHGYRLRHGSFSITPEGEYCSEIIELMNSGNITAPYSAGSWYDTFVLPDSDVTIFAEFEKIPVYEVHLPEETPLGVISVYPKTAYAGTPITVVFTPAPNCRLRTNSIYLYPYEYYEYELEDNILTFILPDMDITLDAVFEEYSSADVNVIFDGFHNEVINFTEDPNKNLHWGDTLTITVEGEYDSYTWFLNGQQQWGYNSLNIDIGTGFTIGTHSLMVVVVKNGIPYSKELIFRVMFKEVN